MSEKKSLIEIIRLLKEMAPDMPAANIHEAIDVTVSNEPGMFSEEEIAEAKIKIGN